MTPQVKTSLPDSLLDKLSLYAKQTNRSQSALIREAVENYFEPDSNTLMLQRQIRRLKEAVESMHNQLHILHESQMLFAFFSFGRLPDIEDTEVAQNAARQKAAKVFRRYQTALRDNLEQNVLLFDELVDTAATKRPMPYDTHESETDPAITDASNDEI